jgi:hypothetical protein
LNRASDHRLLRVSLDGTVNEVALCTGAKCMMSAEHLAVLPEGERTGAVRVLFDDGLAFTIHETPSTPVHSQFGGVLAHGSTVLHAEGADALTLIRRSPARRTRLPMPSLSSNERIHAMVATDDDTYLRIGDVRRRRDVPEGQRQRWVVFRDGSYAPSFAPLVDDGRLCGGLERTDVGTVFVRPDGARVSLQSDLHQKGERQQRCEGDHISIASFQPTYVEWIDARALTTKRVELPNVLRVWTSGTTIFALHPVDGFVRIDDQGHTPLITRRAGHDLAGTAFPRGAVLERVDFKAEGTHVIVLERLRLPTCEIVDRVHVVDLQSQRVTSVRDGRRLSVSPEYAAGAFFIVEAEKETSTVD